MNVIFRDLVEYSGICAELPLCIENYSPFSIDDFILLDNEKYSINKISKVSVKGSVENCRLIKSNIGNSLNGCKSKGFKLICNCKLFWRIEYTDTCKNSIFSLNGESSFNSFVSLSKGSKYSVPIANIFIDDVDVEVLTTNSLIINFTGMIIIENN